LKRQVIKTADGSTTIHIPEWNEQYHSTHGAIQEAYHVFIKHGLHHLVAKKQNNIHVLEIGFGTGLNTFITFLEAGKLNLKIEYTGIEAYPVSQKEITLLNYPSELGVASMFNIFNKFHTLSWEESHEIITSFKFKKQQKKFQDIDDFNKFHLIYFDAFGARVQPELWTKDMFTKMYKALKNDGMLVTYAAKGSVRRAMQEVGFIVEKLPGPPGKREMLRATK